MMFPLPSDPGLREKWTKFVADFKLRKRKTYRCARHILKKNVLHSIAAIESSYIELL